MFRTDSKCKVIVQHILTPGATEATVFFNFCGVSIQRTLNIKENATVNSQQLSLQLSLLSFSVIVGILANHQRLNCLVQVMFPPGSTKEATQKQEF